MHHHANGQALNALNPVMPSHLMDNAGMFAKPCDLHLIDRTRVKRMSKLAYEQESYDGLIAFTDGVLKS